MPKTESGKRFVEAGLNPTENENCYEPAVTDGEGGTAREPREFLRWLLDYEIRGSERYRRFLSLLLIASNHEGDGGIERLKETFRRSDEIIALDEHRAAVLLRETNVDGTLQALQRYKSFHNVMHLRFAVVCYPTDGWNARYILNSASDRIARAMHGPAGAVVC
ncbi:hypothetical protein LLG95_00595 [bacterium]|nr:hypothetical protein [bacterium]